MAGVAWRISAFCALLLLQAAGGVEVNEPSIDLRSFFAVSTNSVCGGDTPIQLPGQCSGSIDNLADGNSSTRWQSANGETSVDISFTLTQPDVSLRLRGIRVIAGVNLPRYLYLEERRASEQNFTTLRVYVFNSTRDCNGTDNCVEWTVEESLSDGAVVLLCPVAASEPVAEVRIRMVGLLDTSQNETSQYHVISEVELLGWVAEGYFVRSLTAVSVEGEMGYPVALDLSSPEGVPTSTDETLIAGFSSRGFATLSINISSQETFEWEFPSIPQTTTYQLWFRYTNPGGEVRLGAMVISGEQFYNARIVFRNCPPPTSCHAPLFSLNMLDTASFTLIAGDATILALTLSHIDLNLDVIFAIPMAFYEATVLEVESERYLQSCDFIGGSLGRGTADEQFCLESAVQLSLDFYQFTYECGCSEVGAVGDECAVYGGQCDCIDQSDDISRITGRRCDMCPFMTYLTTNGCAECDCMDPTDNDCHVTTGQCVCPPLVTGRTCDECMENSYGDPLTGCSVCGCDLDGSAYCNSTTGECVCKEGVTGVDCSVCDVGWFNLSSLGCEECGCDSVGSVTGDCDNDGQCTCRANIEGSKCSSCLPGSFFFSSEGCSLCNCSGRTNNCSQNPNVTSEPSELCTCPTPYVGRSCDQCADGWFMSDITGNCELCRCNGLADTCLDGNGTCLGCRGNSSGVQCDVCIDGYYDADPSDLGISCLQCPCTTVTALDTLCVPDSSGSPVCNCRVGHEGLTCDTCSDGYFGSPPQFRCTQCGCNGNIDPLDTGSCDMVTGRCLMCINNSTGDECEMCATGFYGNATQQDCQLCDCHALGSDGSLCDSVTGQCSCLPGVNGLRCEQCLPGYWNFTATVGCQLCSCVGSVASDVCDVESGVCECRDGVGGQDCSYCLPGFFNYSIDSGCTLCECGEGAINGSCSAEGQCYCQPGVGGVKCDQCLPFTFTLSTSGCQSCGECEQSLRNDLSREDAILRGVLGQADLLMQLSTVDMEGLGEVMRVAGLVREDSESIADTLNEIESQIYWVNNSFTTTRETVARIDERVGDSLSVTFELQPLAEEVGDHIQGIYNEIQPGLVQLVDITALTEAAQTLTALQARQAEEIARNMSEIEDMHRGNYSSHVEAIRDRVEWANQIAGEAMNARNVSQSLNCEAQNLIGQYQDIASDVEIISSSLEGVNETLTRVQSSLDETANTIYDIRDDVTVFNDVIDRSQTEIESVERVTEDTRTHLTAVCDAIDILTLWVGNETPDVSGSGTESDGLLEPELSDDIGSGSGVELSPDSITERVAYLCEGVEGVGEGVTVCENVVQTALNYSLTLQQGENMICSVLSESLMAGGVAVEAILNFTSSIEAIEEAVRITMETGMVLEEVEREGREEGDLEREANELLLTSQQLLQEAQTEAVRVAEHISEVEAAEGVVEDARRQAVMATQSVEYLQQTVSTLANVTASAISQSSSDVQCVEVSFNVTSTTHSLLSTLVTTLPSNASSIIATVNETSEIIDLTHTTIDTSNNTVMDVRSELVEKQTQLGQVQELQVANGDDLVSLESGLAELREELERAKRAVAMIDVALRFNGSSSLGYTTTGLTTDHLATRISLMFNPSETSGLMLHSSAVEGDQYSVSLSLENGSIAFNTEVGRVEGVEHVVTTPRVIQAGTWYQLYATREGMTSQLSVSELQGGDTHTSSFTSSTSPLPPNGTLYLGGSPQPAVAVGYAGCLDRVVVNNALVPLLLPDQVEGEPLSLCGPRPPSEAPRAVETGVWLQGGGSYVQVVTPLITGTSPLLIHFRTFADTGLLLTLYSDDMAQRLAVVVVNGRLRLQFSRDVITMATGDTATVVNDGEWHVAEVEVNDTTAFLLVDSNERVTASSAMSSSPFVPSSNQLYIGGLPSALPTTGSSEPSLAGCVRYLHVAGVPVAINSSRNFSRVSFGGCPAVVVPGVRFTGEGAAELQPSTEDVSHVSLQFHSTQLASLLLQLGNEGNSISVSLYHTRIRVDHPGGVLYSIQDGLNDNAWHYVELELGNDRMNLTVDEATVTTPTSSSQPPAGSDITVGGVTTPTSLAVTESFRGCINQLVINDMLIDFSQAVSLVGVALYGCSPESVPVTTPLPPPPPPPLPPPPSINPNTSVGLDGRDGSFLAISLDRHELAPSYIITLQFQTSSPNAMLLYAQGNYDFLALEIKRGFLYYTFNLGSGRVTLTSTQTYNDGLEHLVELHRSGRNSTIVIDEGSEIKSGVSLGSFTSLNIAMEILFVGGTPLAFPPTNLITFRTTGEEEVPPSIRGCVLSLSINGVYSNLSAVQASSGAEECLQFYANIATFHGFGYLQLLDEVSGGVEFSASLEFRTTSCTSLLLYSASSRHPDHLALEMVDGVVRFIFDNGFTPTVIEFLPPNPLCDDQWHSVSLVKDQITGALSIDGGSPIVEDSDIESFVSLELDSPLFIGGVPNVQALRSTVMSSQVDSSSFDGCIRNVYVSTSRTGPLERDLAQATQSSGVTFHTCDP